MTGFHDLMDISLTQRNVNAIRQVQILQYNGVNYANNIQNHQTTCHIDQGLMDVGYAIYLFYIKIHSLEFRPYPPSRLTVCLSKIHYRQLINS